MPRFALPADPRTRLATQALILVGALTLANLLFNLVARACGLGLPYTTFLPDPTDNFGDFFSLLRSYPHGASAILPDRLGLHALLPVDPPSTHFFRIGNLRPVTNFHMMPLSTLLAIAALALTRAIDPMLLFLLLNAALAAYLARLACRHAARRGEALAWAALGIFCYPMLVMAARGNLLAGLTGLLMLDALLLGLARRAPVRAALLFAIACNIRPNAIILALPLLAFYWPQKRRFTIALTIAGWAILGAAFPLAHHFYPPYTFASFRAGLDAYYKLYAIGYFGIAYGSSLFGAVKILADGWRPGMDAAAAIVALVIALAGTALHALRRIGDAGLLYLAAAGCTLGTTVLGDYHLGIFLIVPMALAATAGKASADSAQARRLMFVTVCLMLAPKNYMFWFDRASLQVVLNPALLLATALAVIAEATAAELAARRPAARPIAAA